MKKYWEDRHHHDNASVINNSKALAATTIMPFCPVTKTGHDLVGNGADIVRHFFDTVIRVNKRGCAGAQAFLIKPGHINGDAVHGNAANNRCRPSTN